MAAATTKAASVKTVVNVQVNAISDRLLVRKLPHKEGVDMIRLADKSFGAAVALVVVGDV
jgi:ACT domain-containing protein